MYICIYVYRYYMRLQMDIMQAMRALSVHTAYISRIHRSHTCGMTQ